MNIIHVIGSLEIGGIQKYVIQLSQSLILDQFRHKILTTIPSKSNYISSNRENRIKIDYLLFTYLPKSYIPHRINKLFRYLFAKLFFFRMWYYLIRSEIDIVHIHIHSQIISQMFASVLSGRRVIWTIHGEYSLGKITIWIIRMIDSILPYDKCKIIADSKSALWSTLPYTMKNLHPNNIIPTGIDPEPYLREYDKSSIRKKNNIAEDTILIGSSGRIVWEKGYDQLLCLLEEYNFNEKKIHFVIAGEGFLRNQYIKQIETLHLEDKISFIGNISNIPEFLSTLDIYIQPSLTEGFPLSVLEAMATGLPIICSDAGGLKEMINNNINGIIYKSGDLNSLYTMLCKILNMNVDELYLLGRNVKDHVLKKFTLSKSAQEYKTLYNFKEKRN